MAFTSSFPTRRAPFRAPRRVCLRVRRSTFESLEDRRLLAALEAELTAHSGFYFYRASENFPPGFSVEVSQQQSNSRERQVGNGGVSSAVDVQEEPTYIACGHLCIERVDTGIPTEDVLNTQIQSSAEASFTGNTGTLTVRASLQDAGNISGAEPVDPPAPAQIVQSEAGASGRLYIGPFSNPATLTFTADHTGETPCTGGHRTRTRSYIGLTNIVPGTPLVLDLPAGSQVEAVLGTAIIDCYPNPSPSFPFIDAYPASNQSTQGTLQVDVEERLPKLKRVEAPYDDSDATDLVLGGYLPGVRLEQPISLYFDLIDAADLDEVYLTSTVFASEDNPDAKVPAILNDAQDGWVTQNPVNMGLFTEDTQVSLVASNNEGFELSDAFTVQVAQPLDLEVQVVLQSSTAAVEDVRFIEPISVPRQRFRVPLADANLPLKADGDPYRTMLDLVLVGKDEMDKDVEYPFRPSLFSNSSEFTADVNGLAAEEFQVLVKAADTEGRRFRTKDVVLSDAETLLKIELPSWIEAKAPNDLTYDQASENYLLQVKVPKQLNHQLPTTSGTLFGLFDGLESFVGAGATLKITAPLVAMDETTASVAFDNLFAEVKLLDQTLFEKEITAAQLGITTEGSTLKARYLNQGVVAVSQKNKDGIDLLPYIDPQYRKLFDVSFGDAASSSYTLNLTSASQQALKALNVLTSATLTPSVAFSGKFEGNLSKARLKYQVKFTAADGQLVPDDSYLNVDVQADAEATLQFQAGVSFLGFSLIEATATANLKTWASVQGGVNFAGPAYAPWIHAATAQGTAGLNASVDYAIEALENEIVDDTLTFDPKQFELFSLGTPPAPPQWEDSSGYELFEGSTMVASMPALSPAEGSSFALMGADGQGGRLRFAAPVDGRVEQVQYQAAVFADSPSLTPDTHYLEAVLIGSEIVLQRSDLATLPLEANAESGGFSSGWQALSGVPQDPLDPGRPYRVEFRLVSDPQSQETVQVALDDLQLTDGQPNLDWFSPDDPLGDNTLDFSGPERGQAITSIYVRNTGTRTGLVKSASIVGSGFRVSVPGSIPVYAWDESPLQVQVDDPFSSATAVLRIETDDPTRPVQEIGLAYTARQVAWRNPADPYDVNDDGFVTPSDFFSVVLDLNLRGGRELPEPEGDDFPPPFLDVNGDDRVTPSDALQVVNYLNQSAGGEGESVPRRGWDPRSGEAWTELPAAADAGWTQGPPVDEPGRPAGGGGSEFTRVATSPGLAARSRVTLPTGVASLNDVALARGHESVEVGDAWDEGLLRLLETDLVASIKAGRGSSGPGPSLPTPRRPS